MRKLDPFKAAHKDRRPIDYYAKVFRKPFFVLSSTCYSIDSKWLFTKLSESLKFLKLIIDSLQSVRAACFKNGGSNLYIITRFLFNYDTDCPGVTC